MRPVEDLFIPAAEFKPAAGKPRLDDGAWIVAHGDAVECGIPETSRRIDSSELAQRGDLVLELAIVGSPAFGGLLTLEAADLGLGALHYREAKIDTRVPETSKAARSQLCYFASEFADRSSTRRGPDFTVCARPVCRALVGELALRVSGGGVGAANDVHRFLGVIVRRIRSAP